MVRAPISFERLTLFGDCLDLIVQASHLIVIAFHLGSKLECKVLHDLRLALRLAGSLLRDDLVICSDELIDIVDHRTDLQKERIGVLKGNDLRRLLDLLGNALAIDLKIALQKGEFFPVGLQIDGRHDIVGVCLKHPDNLLRLFLVHLLELAKVPDVLLILRIKGGGNIIFKVLRELLLTVRAFPTGCTGIMGMAITDPIRGRITEGFHKP